MLIDAATETDAAKTARGAGHVLIVDDVVTTGATCGRLADVLRNAGVRRVSVLALARAATPD